MLFDKFLFLEIGKVGKSLLQKSGLSTAPTSASEMAKFLLTVKSNIDDESFDGLLLGNIFFSFVTNIEVRDRQVTSRIFEDIFSGIFSLTPTDKTVRRNPVPVEELIKLDVLCHDEDWNISSDLSGNKREKTDVHIGNYEVSLKTLKGIAVDENNNIIDRNFNPELNVGSLSFRALLKGIIADDQLSRLRDRKGGLGSGGQVRQFMLNPIKSNKKGPDFLKRLKLFMEYVYSDDVFIVLKSHYVIKFILVPADSFINAIVTLYANDESEFEKVWYRWENNNLRFQWQSLLRYMKKYNLNYTEIDINLSKATSNAKILKFFDQIQTSIAKSLDEFVE